MVYFGVSAAGGSAIPSRGMMIKIFQFFLFFPTGKEASGHSETHDVEEIER